MRDPSDPAPESIPPAHSSASRPLRVWPAGVAVWLGTVGVGMILRALTGQTVVLPFIIVALLSLAVFLLGYRLVAAGVRRLRSRRRQA